MLQLQDGFGSGQLTQQACLLSLIWLNREQTDPFDLFICTSLARQCLI